jgi:hypothetical protein
MTSFNPRKPLSPIARVAFEAVSRDLTTASLKRLTGAALLFREIADHPNEAYTMGLALSAKLAGELHNITAGLLCFTQEEMNNPEKVSPTPEQQLLAALFVHFSFHTKDPLAAAKAAVLALGHELPAHIIASEA